MDVLAEVSLFARFFHKLLLQFADTDLARFQLTERAVAVLDGDAQLVPQSYLLLVDVGAVTECLKEAQGHKNALKALLTVNTEVDLLLEFSESL